MQKSLFLLTMMMVVGWGVLVQPAWAENKETFKPSYSFHGTVEFNADSYFGDYPVIDFRNSKGWKYNDALVETLPAKYGLDNPTRPDLNQKLEMSFYANPLPDLEVFLKPKYQGSVIWDQVYLSFYSEKAMYTLGWFKFELGALGLLWGDDSSFDALMVNTKWKETWFTGLISQLNDDYYNGDSANFPYLGQGTDDLVAGCFARKYGDNRVALNLMLDGFDNEKAVSMDFNGRVGGIPVTAEAGVVFPSALNRNFNVEPNTSEDKDGDNQLDPGEDLDGDGKLSEVPAVQVDELAKGWYPGLVVSVNVAENNKNLVRFTIGGMTKGFWTLYGTRNQREMEDAVKFGRNLWGADLLWQHALKENWFLSANLTVLDPIDQDFFEQYQKHVPLATRVLGFKLKKQLSPRSEISGALTYYGDAYFNYGKLDFKWRTVF